MEPQTVRTLRVLRNKPGTPTRPGSIVRGVCSYPSEPPFNESPVSPHRRLAGDSTLLQADLHLPFRTFLQIMRQLSKLHAGKGGRRYFFLGIVWTLSMIRVIGLRVK